MTRSEHAQFAHAASQIGKDIASIYDKLHGLTKRKYTFNFNFNYLYLLF